MKKNRHNKSEPILENRHLMPHPSRTLDPAYTIVDQAHEIQSADQSIQTHVTGKLDLIVKQIRSLQQEAKAIMDQAQRDMELHRVKCNFVKKIGQIIHLYKKTNGESYFSLLSLDDWEGKPPHQFMGSYLLNPDNSFEKMDSDI